MLPINNKCLKINTDSKINLKLNWKEKTLLSAEILILIVVYDQLSPLKLERVKIELVHGKSRN